MATQNTKGEGAPSLTHVLDAVKERGKRLDAADTAISNLIKDAETELQEHLSVRVSATIDVENGSGRETVLAWGKEGGKWHLLIQTDFPDGSGDTTPLLSCPREMRARIFSDGHLEALVRDAIGQLDKQIELREKAIENGTDLVRALRGIPF